MPGAVRYAAKSTWLQYRYFKFEYKEFEISDDAPVAQGIEQLPSKQWVAGSNPAGCTKVKRLKYYHGGEKPFAKKEIRSQVVQAH